MSRRVQLPVLTPTRSTAAAVARADEVLGLYEKKEKCGVVGVWGADHAARLTYLAMYAQQHRGQ